MIRFRHSALALLARAMAAAVRPPAKMDPAEWAADNLVVPDGPRAGEKWSADLTPYIVEPLNAFGPDSGVNEIAVMKSAQTGFTTLAIAAAGHSIDRDPCDMMIIQPTADALSDFNRLKLGRAIESSAALKSKVAPQVAKAGSGSTTSSKVFGNFALTLAISSSAADLRSKTVKKLIRDEIDQYPDDLDDQGSPIEISDGRLIAFLEAGDWRKLDISTPTIKGASKIEERFEAGDRRRWHVPCPGCGEYFVFDFHVGFQFSRTWPHKAHYVAQCCGSIVLGHEKNALIRRGKWIATDPQPGKFRSYHLDTLSSPLVPWDEIAKVYVSAGDNPQKLKAFWNLWLGLPYEMKGDTPEHESLLARRENYPQRSVPAGGLILVAAADVQMRGVWYEVLAIGRDRQSWVVDAGYCDGDTSSPDSEAFRLLEAATIGRTFRDAWGRERQVDALAIDSGYRSHVVYSWVREHQAQHPITGQDVVHAVKGVEGWGRPAIGLPSLVDINLAGRRVKQGCRLWPVGTWPLKGAFFADLGKPGVMHGKERNPEGFCHFGEWLDEAYFRQLTAEYLGDDKNKRGMIVRVWKKRSSQADNHLLDCRIYNLAMAEHLGLSFMTELEWAAIVARHGRPPAEELPPLLEAALPDAPATPPAPPSPASPPPAAFVPSARPGFLPRRQSSFWGR
jgi:phage terminase large subunit GpA-like protein